MHVKLRRPAGRPDGRSSAAPVSSKAPKTKSFDRGGPVWPPRSNVANDGLGGPILRCGVTPSLRPHSSSTTLFDFEANLGGFWCQVRPPTNGPRLGFFAGCVQEAPKRLQECPKGVSRTSNGLPRGPQECPKSAQGTPKVPPEGHSFEDFLVFQCFSTFSCVFLCFFTAYPR